MYRLVDQKKWAGVAAGMGWYFGIDPVLIRIGFVVLGFMAGPVSLGLYVLLWIFLPEATSQRVPMSAPKPAGGRSRGVTAAAIVLGAMIFGQIDLFRGDVLLAAALIGLGVLLFNDRREVPTTPFPTGGPSTPPPPAPDAVPTNLPFTEAPTMPSSSSTSPSATPPSATLPPPPRPQDATVAHERSDTGGPADCGPPWRRGPGQGSHRRTTTAYPTGYTASWSGTPRPSVPPTPPWGRSRSRPRSTLFPLSFGVWLLTLGGAALMDRMGLVELTLFNAAALSLLVAGLGLLVGTWFGRARRLIPIGLLAGVVMLGAAAAPTIDLPRALEGGLGERRYTPVVVEDVQPEYQLLAGQMVLDLTDLEAGTDAVAIDASVVLGELQVLVGPDVTVEAVGTLSAGDYTVLGETNSGSDLQFDIVDRGVEGAGRIRLDLETSLGEITVTREDPQ